MRFSLWTVGLVACLLLACRSGGRPVTLNRERSDARSDVQAGPMMQKVAAPASAPRDELAAAGSLAHSPATTTDPAMGSSMVIRTGNASLEVDSLEPAMNGLRRLAERVGGFVGNSAIQSGREQLRQATMEIKVPAARFDELTSGLPPLGRVEFVNISAEDVGEEFVDLTARVGNSRRLEERLIDLLGSRTGRLQDVLAVERELARVREEIERQEGRLRYLKSRVALSTLSVTIHEPPPILAHQPGWNPLWEAMRQAWRNFVALLAGVIASLGFVVPVAAAAGAGIFLVRRIKRRA
ncbi:MAG TPA: DUF4349 domain-containing protein [Gemmatimonadales bacterium]|jgi:hypothetical protein|nr:DUF4349 domain-containing protein [Gemmatimonadales bacterium]